MPGQAQTKEVTLFRLGVEAVRGASPVANAVGRRRAKNAPELERNVRSYLRSTQRRPDIVRGYFEHPDVQYAAA